MDEAVSYETASDDEKDYASVIASAPLHSYAGQCTYCGHCKPCPVNIDIAMVNKFFDLAVQQETVRMDKVNQALAMFGMEAVPGMMDRER